MEEEYRGHRISEKLISFANEYAKQIGFDKTYIPSEHIGLYEKFGWQFVEEVRTFRDDSPIERLYRLELI